MAKEFRPDKGKAVETERRPGRDKKDVTCFKCQRKGHYANECPYVKRVVMLETGHWEEIESDNEEPYEGDEEDFQRNSGKEIAFQCDSALSLLDFVQYPPISKTKGSLKRKQYKGGNEVTKSMNTCRSCNGVGHNIATCSKKENVDFSAKTQKQKKEKAEDMDLNPILYLKN